MNAVPGIKLFFGLIAGSYVGRMGKIQLPNFGASFVRVGRIETKITQDKRVFFGLDSPSDYEGSLYFSADEIVNGFKLLSEDFEEYKYPQKQFLTYRRG